MGAKVTETLYGFKWGPAAIERHISDEKWGVLLNIKTPRQSVDVRITPSGLIRLGKVVPEATPSNSTNRTTEEKP